MKANILWVVLVAFFFNCCRHSTSTIKSESIKLQVLEFVKVAKSVYSKVPRGDTILLTFNKVGKYYEVEFDYVAPDSYENIYCIIQDENKVIFVYSKSNLMEFFEVKHPFNADTSIYKIDYNIYGEVDWYSDLLYFDGVNFYRDTISKK